MESLRPARILIIGIGALGTEVTYRIARDPTLTPWLQHVSLVDPDHIAPENIAQSRLFHELFRLRGSSIFGTNKAVATASLLAERCAMRWAAHPCEFADLSWELLQNFDLLVSCPDNALARVEVAYAARNLRIPTLDGAVFGSDAAGDALSGGRVTWFAPARMAACYLCGLGEARRAELLATAVSPSLGCYTPAGQALGEDPAINPSLRRTAAVLVARLGRALQARTARGSFYPRRSVATRLGAGGVLSSVDRVRLAPSASCPWHTRRPTLVSIDADEAFQSVLKSQAAQHPDQPSPRLQFPWPVCLLAQCRLCGATDHRPQRLAALRRSSVCPACGASHQLEPLQTVSSVGHNDPVANRTPRQLGWAYRQLFQLRPQWTPGHPGKEQP